MDGEITRRQLVATYKAPPEPEPYKVPRLTVRRVSNGIKISWGRSRAKIRAAMPVDYNVDINLSDGRRLLKVVRSTRRQVTLRNVGSNVGGRVMVAPMRNDDTQGKTRAVNFAPHRGASSG